MVGRCHLGRMTITVNKCKTRRRVTDTVRCYVTCRVSPGKPSPLCRQRCPWLLNEPPADNVPLFAASVVQRRGAPDQTRPLVRRVGRPPHSRGRMIAGRPLGAWRWTVCWRRCLVTDNPACRTCNVMRLLELLVTRAEILLMCCRLNTSSRSYLSPDISHLWFSHLRSLQVEKKGCDRSGTVTSIYTVSSQWNLVPAVYLDSLTSGVWSQC